MGRPGGGNAPGLRQVWGTVADLDLQCIALGNLRLKRRNLRKQLLISRLASAGPQRIGDIQAITFSVS
jgi:hypothetical protein